MFSLSSSGSFKNSERFLSGSKQAQLAQKLNEYGRLGVEALSSATPTDTGKTAMSWSYNVRVTRSKASLFWTNSNVAGGTPVPILLQYGHGTGTGGYVQGRDFINPALRPVFDTISDGVWKAVTGK